MPKSLGIISSLSPHHPPLRLPNRSPPPIGTDQGTPQSRADLAAIKRRSRKTKTPDSGPLFAPFLRLFAANQIRRTKNLYVFPISALLPVQPHPLPSPSPCGWIDPQAEAWFSFSVHSVCSVGRHLRLPLRQTSNAPSPTQTKIIIPPMILPPLHLFRPTSSSAFSKSQRRKIGLQAHAPAQQCEVSVQSVLQNHRLLLCTPIRNSKSPL